LARERELDGEREREGMASDAGEKKVRDGSASMGIPCTALLCSALPWSSDGLIKWQLVQAAAATKPVVLAGVFLLWYTASFVTDAFNKQVAARGSAGESEREREMVERDG
jgi:hypothetical protein